jgi:sialate O-acetylesterase
MDAQCEGTDAVAKARELGPYAFGRHNCIDWPKEPPFGPKWQNWPGVLYANMTASIVPYALRGVLWYQGESSNVDFLYYYDMFAAYVEQCRRDFRDERLPIFTVQLAPYNCHPVGWARFVVQQVRIAEEQEGVYLITSGDIGEVGNIHPMYKRQFGERLWLAADKAVYGGSAEYCGPIYAGHTVRGDRVAVRFTHADSGLVIKDTPDVTVCGEDGVFYPADLTVEGNTLVAYAPEVPNPVHVRYGFADQFRLSLFNGDGLPAAPFRTDSFDK